MEESPDTLLSRLRRELYAARALRLKAIWWHLTSDDLELLRSACNSNDEPDRRAGEPMRLYTIPIVVDDSQPSGLTTGVIECSSN